MDKDILTILLSKILLFKPMADQIVGRVGVIKIVIVINCNLITFSQVIACNCN